MTAVLVMFLSSGVAATEIPIRIDSGTFTYEFDSCGKNIAFTEITTKRDFLDKTTETYFAVIRKGEREFIPSHVERQGNELWVEFGDAPARATFSIDANEYRVLFRLTGLTGEDITSATFLNIPLLTAEFPTSQEFAGCVLALNLRTNVQEIPGPQKKLQATAYERFGFEGAEFALVACEFGELRENLKKVVRAAPALPQYDNPIGGPWAMDAAINRGSYLFDFGDLTEKTVDSWIELVKRLGLNQIDFHTGTSMRFGDLFPNPKLFPKGYDSVKAVIDKLHEAGIAAGLHTYAFFIAKDSPYVTPVPDPGLGKDAVFSLEQGISAEDTFIPVIESTEGMSTTTGFFVRNSVTVQIDNELITYRSISKTPPFGFAECQRGAYGTTPTAHSKGSKVYHLKECFGLFAPDPDSELFVRVAEHTADTFNRCGFDMIYLDALDGEDILAGPEFGWHYGSKFTFEIAKRLLKPALFEMSTFHHHLWYVRSRMGAWDCPTRGYKHFIDIHAKENQKAQLSFLPTNLGWWAVKKWSDDLAQNTFTEPTFPETIEYLMAKCLAFDSGFALIGVNPATIASTPAYDRLAPIFQRYETLRHEGYFPETIKKKLQKPQQDFALDQSPDGKWQFKPAVYVKHKITGLEDASAQWTVQNPFSTQPFRFRIEALLSCEPYDCPQGITLEDFSDLEKFDVPDPSAPLTVQGNNDKTALLVAAPQARKDEIPWAETRRQFEPPLALGNCAALGVWAKGGGHNTLLNIQLRSPEHTVYRGILDRYIPLDSQDWRYTELIEADSDSTLNYSWPYNHSTYELFHMVVDFNQIAQLNLWLNCLPPKERITCELRPIRALPVVSYTFRNPQITLNGMSVTIPAELQSGMYLEFSSEGWILYKPNGAVVASEKVISPGPVIKTGENHLAFHCETDGRLNPRARVTVTLFGDPIVP